MILSPAGESDAERLSCYIGVRRWPGRDERGGQQRGSPHGGAGGPGLSQAGARHFNGRMEVLDLLRLSGVSSIIWHETVGRVPQWNSPSCRRKERRRWSRRRREKKMKMKKEQKKNNPKTRRFIFNFKQTVSQGSRRISVYPTLDHYLVKYERFLGVFIYTKTHLSTFTQLGWFKSVDRPACACPVCGFVPFFFFFFLLGKTKLFCRQRSVHGTDKCGGKNWNPGHACSVLCSALYLCSLKDMASEPARCRLMWNYGHQRRIVFTTTEVFFLFCTSGSFYFMFLCAVNGVCVWMLNILKISQM